jgi:Tfp pilus assembly protein FimT
MLTASMFSICGGVISMQCGRNQQHSAATEISGAQAQSRTAAISSNQHQIAACND